MANFPRNRGHVTGKMSGLCTQTMHAASHVLVLRGALVPFAHAAPSPRRRPTARKRPLTAPMKRPVALDSGRPGSAGILRAPSRGSEGVGSRSTSRVSWADQQHISEDVSSSEDELDFYSLDQYSQPTKPGHPQSEAALAAAALQAAYPRQVIMCDVGGLSLKAAVEALIGVLCSKASTPLTPFSDKAKSDKPSSAKTVSREHAVIQQERCAERLERAHQFRDPNMIAEAEMMLNEAETRLGALTDDDADGEGQDEHPPVDSQQSAVAVRLLEDIRRNITLRADADESL